MGDKHAVSQAGSPLSLLVTEMTVEDVLRLQLVEGSTFYGDFPQ